MATLDREMVVFAPEPESQSAFLQMTDLHVVKSPSTARFRHSKHYFIEVSASRLSQVSDAAKAMNETKSLRALFIREDVSARFLPQLFQRANLRLAQNVLVHAANDWVTPKRVINAWRIGSENELIAAAVVVGDELCVLTCALEKLEVPFNKIPALNSLPPTERGDFEIDEAGSFIHWSQSDIHIDVDAIRYATNANWRRKHDLAKLTYNKTFGAAIAFLRRKHHLRQSDIEGLTDRQLRRIESGDARPSVSTLERLAKAHKLSFNAYLEALGNQLHERMRSD